MYKLFLTLSYLKSRRIAYFAIAAVTLCVAMVLIVMSVMGGWLEQVKLRARALLGDVIVDNRAYSGFPLYQEFIDEIGAWPEVSRATPVLYSYGLIRFRNTAQNGYVRVAGIRLEDVYEINGFKRSLYYENYYPGTTTLAPQRQPLLGLNFGGDYIKLSDDREVPAPTLPAPFSAALAAAREAALRATGRPLDDADAVDSELNTLLRRNGLPIIPGIFDFNLEGGDNQAALAGDELPGLIIGRDLIAERESDGRYERYESYPLGCQVDLTLWAASAQGTVDPIPIRQPFRYADDSRTGIYEIDSLHVYCDFSLLQKLLQMDAADRVNPETGEVVGATPARCSQIQIKAAAGVDAKALADRLTERYQAYLSDERFRQTLNLDERSLVSRVRAMTWEETQAHIIAPVEKEKVLVTILFSIISLVAVALVLCILYMIVLQKTRDIGIIKAIGGSSAGVAQIFVVYGAAVGIVGAALGTLLGSLVVLNINDIQDFLISVHPSLRVWDLKVYSFDRIPSVVRTSDIVAIGGIAVLAATIGSFAAAWRAGAMQPVEAVRYE